MTIYQPYVYIIRWTNANKGYIGVRYSPRCNPSDLFVSYHTSSKSVKQLISEVGLPDQIKIFCYPDKETALIFEEKFQRRFCVLESDYWLNRNIRGISFIGPNKHTLETKKKISLNNRSPSGENHYLFGKSPSKETKKKMSIARKGKPHSTEHRKNVSLSKQGKNHHLYDSLIYHFQKDTGECFIGTRFDFYSRFPGTKSNISALISGKRKTVSGWKLMETFSK